MTAHPTQPAPPGAGQARDGRDEAPGRRWCRRGPRGACGARLSAWHLAAFGVTRRLPVQSLPALMLLVWDRPAVCAASLMSLGST